MKKKLFSLAAVLILSCMLLAGCQSKMVPADQVTGALFELVAMDDASAIQELLGFESEEDVRSSLMEDSSDLVSGLEEMFTGAGITFTQDELDEMKGSLLTMLRKMPYTAEYIQKEYSDSARPDSEHLPCGRNSPKNGITLHSAIYMPARTDHTIFL